MRAGIIKQCRYALPDHRVGVRIANSPPLQGARVPRFTPMKRFSCSHSPQSEVNRHARRRWCTLLAFVTLPLMPACWLHATDYGPLGLGEMVEASSLILLVELKASKEKPNIEIEQVLKGEPPRKLEILRSAADVSMNLSLRGGSDRRILFLHTDDQGRSFPFHPACVAEVDQKDRVLEILAMKRNPAPFVASPKYAGDVDLIYLLGVQFFAARMSVPAVPRLESLFHPRMSRIYGIYEEIPWQRSRLTVSLTYQSARQPRVQMKRFVEKGVLPEFIRRMDVAQLFERLTTSVREDLPPEFDVTVDTTGPANVGDLSFVAAAAFLREQLRSEKLEVIQAAYLALAKLLDSDAVPIAIEMLQHPDRKFCRESARFLGVAKDPRSVRPLCVALDRLPPCIRYAGEGYDADDDQLSEAVGKAVLNLHSPQAIPALKRAALKGYAGDWIALSLSQLGDETAFEPLLSHMRNPDVNHYPSELVTMVRRSNLPVESWMNMVLSSDDRAGKRRRATQWIEWWDSNKTRFRIVRTWQEANRLLK